MNKLLIVNTLPENDSGVASALETLSAGAKGFV